MLTEREIAIVRALQNDLPLVPEPYQVIADQLGISQDDLLAGIENLREKGCLKRISIALRHNNVGYTINVMIVWDVPEERVAEVGRALAAQPQVTHCYDRAKAPEFDYNLYSMVHALTEDDYQTLVQTLVDVVKPIKYEELKTVAELKKIGMRYFME